MESLTRTLAVVETLGEPRAAGGLIMAGGWVNRSDTVRSIARQIRKGATQIRGADRRRFGRLKAGETLACNRGKVLDLSAGGLRLLSRRKLKGMLEVALWDIHRGLTMQCRVVWTKRLGFRRHESGLTFIDVDPDTARGLTALGADNRQFDY